MNEKGNLRRTWGCEFSELEASNNSKYVVVHIEAWYLSFSFAVMEDKLGYFSIE